MKTAKNLFCALVLCVAIVAMMTGAHVLGSKLAGYPPSLGTFTFGAVISLIFLYCYHIAQQDETTHAEPSRIIPSHDEASKRVYISGPMTGLARREFLRRFAVAEVTLARLGYEPVNPARFIICKPWFFRLIGYRLTLIYDLWRLSQCDAITYLPNWTASGGANVEHRYATSVGIPEIPEQLKVWCAVESDIQDRDIASRNHEPLTMNPEP